MCVDVFIDVRGKIKVLMVVDVVRMIDYCMGVEFYLGNFWRNIEMYLVS